MALELIELKPLELKPIDLKSIHLKAIDLESFITIADLPQMPKLTSKSTPMHIHHPTFRVTHSVCGAFLIDENPCPFS
jgi:hypothetical protein